SFEEDSEVRSRMTARIRVSWGRCLPYLVLLLYMATLPRQFHRLFPAGLWNVDFWKAYYAVGRSILDERTFTYSYEGFKNMPVVGLLLVPFAIGAKAAAASRFFVFELACYLGCFAVADRLCARSQSDRWILLALFVLSMGFVNTIEFGQLTV